VAEAQALLARYGYGVPSTGVLDHETEFVVRAFQRHFRPARVDGRIDRSTLDTLRRLVEGCSPLAV
jgi:N-acetylmuramoyl-L-alanine amidase